MTVPKIPITGAANAGGTLLHHSQWPRCRDCRIMACMSGLLVGQSDEREEEKRYGDIDWVYDKDQGGPIDAPINTMRYPVFLVGMNFFTFT